MGIREVDAISDAIIETEKEIAGGAWDIEETEALDASGDRSLEDMGEGLEGQHEADDELEAEAEGDESGEGEGTEGEGEGEQQVAAAGKEGQGETKPPARQGEPEGRIPPARLREANDRARAAEAERDAERAARTEERNRVAALEAQMQTLTQLLQRGPAPQQPQAETRPEPKSPPDIFENPTGFADYLQQSFQSQFAQRDQQLQQMRVENSFAIAHGFHKETFEEAMGAVNKLNVQNPDDRATVQRIYNSPNPGEALVSWHKRNKTLAAVGDDPTAYTDRIRNETRESLMKDPEFRKQLLADLRAEASAGNDGSPRTTTRLPKSLNNAAGSNLRAERSDPRANDDSDQGIADAAWR